MCFIYTRKQRAGAAWVYVNIVMSFEAQTREDDDDDWLRKCFSLSLSYSVFVINHHS